MSPRYLRVAALSVAMLIGCSRQPEGSKTAPPPSSKGPIADNAPHTDPHDVPISEKDVDIPQTYAAFVAQIEQLSDTIKERIQAGTPTKAHRPLDELDIILKKAPEIAEKDVAKEHWKEVNVASQDLAAAHDQLHQSIDAKQAPDYEAVSAKIADAMAKLKAVPAANVPDEKTTQEETKTKADDADKKVSETEKPNEQ